MRESIKFDKLKIITKEKYISYINPEAFIKNESCGRISSWTYDCSSPFSLRIEKNRKRNELIIEFTGKILLEDYPKLIGIDNIILCLKNINNLGVCKLDVDSILRDSYVTKCDVTVDVPYTQLKELTTRIIENINNHKKYVYKKTDDNLEITNCLKTKNLKTRLIIYDKEREMRMPKNGVFLKSTSNSNEILNHFKNKVRFELNLNSMELIRRYLGIKNTELISVLKSTNNPIMDFFNKILINVKNMPTGIRSLRDYERYMLLKGCHFNLPEVETIVRKYISPTASVKRSMEPYHNLLHSCKEETVGVLDELKKILTGSCL